MDPVGAPAPAAAPKVPAADSVLRVLTYLAAQRGPVPAARVAADLDLPRSTTYDLLAVMVEHGYALHLGAERSYALGPSAHEVSAGYARHEPLARVGRRVVERMVDAVGESGHLVSLHGRDVLYIVEERARGRESLVTDRGVRLPAHLTASGRAMLAALTPVQLRSLYASSEDFSHRTGAESPETPAQLREVLTEVRREGVAREDGEVTEGLRSVAAAVLDRAGWPLAAIAMTWRADTRDAAGEAACEQAVRRGAVELGRAAVGPRP